MVLIYDIKIIIFLKSNILIYFKNILKYNIYYTQIKLYISCFIASNNFFFLDD